MRLIDADALKGLMIEVLLHIKENPKMDGEERHLLAGMHMLGEMIDDAPTIEAATDWHYMEDGMPEEESDYLITYEIFKHKIVASAWYRADENRFIEPYYCEEYQNVIAWAELPKPAERKEE